MIERFLAKKAAPRSTPDLFEYHFTTQKNSMLSSNLGFLLTNRSAISITSIPWANVFPKRISVMMSPNEVNPFYDHRGEGGDSCESSLTS